jgi:phosphoribosylanthranilate isomerase
VTAVKVCCIQDLGEARLAAEAGATFAGLVGVMPSGPGPISDEAIALLAARMPDGITPTLLTARATAEAIAGHVRATGVRAVQIVRAVPARVRRELRELLPGVALLQVVHVEGPASVSAALEASEWADFVLLDSGRPSAQVPELGGTGRVHDWALSAEIVGRCPVPVLLAGGLAPGNVAQAVATVHPWGVDVCSGLRDATGRLVPDRLSAFMEAVRG